ncbi:MAG: DnaJ domain-containing protein [Clostridiales Family XIII bacterium]|jgi:molecular chaperone DnaJ|nr:DnaJ domain-containing protein [Clostridiales Family XIII bacterium]
MSNPYEILGVREGASKEEIKAAYKEQVKKYHPDKHQNNPLYELAEEKLQEINAAYDYLMKNGGRAEGFPGFGDAPGSRGASGRGSGYYGSSPAFREARLAIDRGDLLEAERLLSAGADRSAEWFFLTAMLQLRKGWYDEAVTNLQMAISMDPGNPEYRRAMNAILAQTGGYQAGSYERGYQDANRQLCQCMQCWCCTEMLCDCV